MLQSVPCTLNFICTIVSLRLLQVLFDLFRLCCWEVHGSILLQICWGCPCQCLFSRFLNELRDGAFTTFPGRESHAFTTLLLKLLTLTLALTFRRDLCLNNLIVCLCTLLKILSLSNLSMSLKKSLSLYSVSPF